MKKMHIIGLTGRSGSGKDTVADLLATHAGFSKIAFSDPLYAEVADGFSVSHQELAARATKEQPQERFALSRCNSGSFINSMLKGAPRHGDPTRSAWLVDALERPRSPRELLRLWGTEYRRIERPGYWASALLSRINVRIQNGESRFVITDVRFDNEAELVRNFGGCIWQVKRAGQVTTGDHVSEVDGSEFKPDACINNLHDVRHLQHVVLAEWWSEEVGLSKAELTAIGDTVREAA